jgi:hypothetical protein
MDGMLNHVDFVQLIGGIFKGGKHAGMMIIYKAN